MPDWHDHLIVDDESLRQILIDAQTIAVIGYKSDPSAVAHRIPQYMRERGFRIIPVNPKLMNDDPPAVGSLADVREPIDIVNIFRASPNVPPHVDEILSLPRRPRLVWMQLGIRHSEGAERLARAGVKVVQDRCIMVDHRTLVGS